jgi:RNA polymerase sigma-70 factor, ECF subfamily
MRRILVHFARSRDSQKRGGQYPQVSLAENMIRAPHPDGDMIELDDALTALAEIDPRMATVVELRFFGGLTLEEIAQVLESSVNIVWRDWDMAKSWLYREMRHGAK